MPKVVDAAAQRHEIRRAARSVFARRGLKGTGLAHVAEAAGMGRSSLYHYYRDKRALVRDLLRDLVEEELSSFAALAESEATPLERIEGLARGQIALFDNWAPLTPLLFDLRSSETRRFRPFFAELRGYLAGVIEEGQSSGEMDAALDPELAAAIAIGAIDGLLIQHFIDREAFPDLLALGDALASSLRRMLTA